MSKKSKVNLDVREELEVYQDSESSLEYEELERILIEEYGLTKIDPSKANDLIRDKEERGVTIKFGKFESSPLIVKRPNDTFANKAKKPISKEELSKKGLKPVTSKKVDVGGEYTTIKVRIKGEEHKLRVLGRAIPRTYTDSDSKGGNELSIKIFSSNSPTLINEITEEILENSKDILVFNDVVPLINNLEFIDFIVNQRVHFTSIKNPEIAQPFSDTLLYFSSRLDEKVGGNRLAGKRNKLEADKFALKIGPMLDELDGKGYHSFGSKATQLNEKKVKTLRGKNWTRNAVKMTLERWQSLKAKEEKVKPSSKSPNPD